MTGGTAPFRWWVEENWTSPVDLAALPGPADPIWEVAYDNDLEAGKRTTRRIPLDLDQAAARLGRPEVLDEWSARLGYRVEFDPTGHGAGLHVTRPGGFLACHLDYDRHPVVTGRRRALNLIVFLNPTWSPDWGGALCLCDPMGRPVERILPAPGRLVAFECGDLSYHQVEAIEGPVERVSVAVYLLAEASASSTRQRALFMPNRR